MSNLRFVLRSLLHAKGFAIAVVLTLGLGLGANTAIFSAIRGVMLKPLPHSHGDRLLYLRQSMEGPGGENVRFSVPEVNDFRASSRTLAGIAEYSPITLTLVDDDNPARIDVGLVTGNYFSVMGLTPILGRAFRDADDGPGAAPVMILTHEYWQSRFGGDSSILGRALRVNGKAVPVVGVLQAAPNFPDRMDVLMNMVNSEHHVSATMVTGRTHRMTEMIARLSPTASVAQAKTEVDAISSRVHSDFPEAYDAGSRFRVTVTPFQEVLGEKAKLTLLLLMGAAAFVLFIACANVANLTLMRGVRREHEFVVRAALGAGTTGLRKLLLLENLVLAIAGALLGLAIAFGGVRLLVSFAQRYSARANEIQIDLPVLAFAITLSVGVAVILSFTPRLAREGELGEALAAGGKRTSGGIKRKRLQQGLVIAQIAVTMMLLTGAGLLTRTMQRLTQVDPGLDASNALTMEVPIDFGAESSAVSIARYQRMRDALAALPGVREVGLGSTVPLRSAGIVLDIKAEGRAINPGEPTPQSEYRTSEPGYFNAAGIPLLAGREFSATDNARSARVVILNKTLADRLFPGSDAVGKRVAWTGDVLRFIGVSDGWRTVVGVVGDTRDGGLDAAPIPALFAPFTQGDFVSGGFVIRANNNAASLASAATRVVRAIAPQAPIEKLLTLDQIRDESVGPRRLNAMLVGAFGILSLIVAAIGIAAVLAFSVSARTNEIGIRMSLGADSGRVQRMVLSEGGTLVLSGLAIGLVGALLLSGVVKRLLYGIQPNDPLTLVSVTALMGLIGIGACWIPALRAARIDPANALRRE